MGGFGFPYSITDLKEASSYSYLTKVLFFPNRRATGIGGARVTIAPPNFDS